MKGAGSAVIGAFERFVIISLKHRVDRRADMARELRRIGLADDEIERAFFDAIQPDDAGPFPSRGARGCFLSHLEVLRAAKYSRIESVLIIEDDLDFTDQIHMHSMNLVEIINSKNWNIFYGGHEIVQWEPDAPGPVVEVPSRVQVKCTHMVGLRGEAIADHIAYLEAILSRPGGDPAGGPMHVDGAYSWFRRAHPHYRTLACVPPIGVQRPSRTDVHALRWFDRTPLLRDVVTSLRRLR